MKIGVFVWAGLVLLVGAEEPPPEVTAPQGRLRGTHSTTLGGRRVAAFFGIPYGKPPAGKYRFAESVAAGPWEGTFEAVHRPSPCMQYSHETYTTSKFAVYGSEDCLYLSVFTPKIPAANSTPAASDLLDVVVYIHGGAFMFHYGGTHGPKYLLDKDIVLVTIQYRLGPLGFLSTEDEVVPGNNGLKDQVLALKWVRDNIAAFGGNPASVVLAGTSAGGASTHYHFLSPMSKGLFKAGHSMSGSALCPWAQTEGSRQKAEEVARLLGCPTADHRRMVACLRARPASHIVSTVPSFMPWMYNPFSPFGPVVENPTTSANPFLPLSPLDALQSGAFNQVPWLTTFTSHEGLYPAAEIGENLEAQKELDRRWEELGPYLLDINLTASDPRSEAKAARLHYLKDGRLPEAFPQLVQMLGDWLFVAPIGKAAMMQSKFSPVYSYQFTYRGKHSISEVMSGSDKDFGTSHGDDTGYIFETENLNPEGDLGMVKRMLDLFESFVKTGVPNWEGGENWPKVSGNSLSYRDILNDESAPILSTEDPGQLAFWSNLLTPKQPPIKEEL